MKSLMLILNGLFLLLFFFNEKMIFFLIIKVMSQFLIKLRYYLFMKHTP